MMKLLTENLTVRHVQPEEVIIMQSEQIIDMQTDEFITDKAFFYIILNGDFKVSGLNFNKKAKKTKQEKLMEA